MADPTQIIAIANFVAGSDFTAIVTNLTTLSAEPLPVCNTSIVLQNFLVSAKALMQLAPADVERLNQPPPLNPTTLTTATTIGLASGSSSAAAASG